MSSGIYDGKRRLSYRKRMEQYCEKNGIAIESRFHQEETAKIAIIDWSIEQRPILLWRTFNREIDVYRYLREQNKHPANYQVLNFKSGKEYILKMAEKPEVLRTFNNQIDADPIYGKNA